MGGFEFVVAFSGAVLVGVGDYLGYAEGFGVEGGLGDEAVGKGEAEEAGDAGG